MTSRRRPTTELDDGVAVPAPPPDLAGTQFRFEDGAYAVLSFPTESGRVPDALTPAEREVLRALLRCRSNLQIAGERGTSVRTIANQVQSLFRKLGVGSRAELAAWAGRSKIRR